MPQKQKSLYTDQKEKRMNLNLKVKLNGKQLCKTNSGKILV